MAKSQKELLEENMKLREQVKTLTAENKSLHSGKKTKKAPYKQHHYDLGDK